MRTTVAPSRLSTLWTLSTLWKLTGLLALLSLTACSGNAAPAATPPGCGMVPSERVVGLVGKNVTSIRQGSVSDLRTRHRAATCTTTNRTHPGRSLRIVARYHPKPLRLATTGCTSGQVFAGTPEKFAPACQAIIGKRHVTRLTVRWQPYVVEVTVSRLDPVWAGDAEQGLAMSRVLAQRLHVAEAAGTG
jgi:hypothetical protein